MFGAFSNSILHSAQTIAHFLYSYLQTNEILSELDVSKAESTSDSDDKIEILRLVDKSGGPALVNNEARRRCRKWVHQTINELLEEHEARSLDPSLDRELAILCHNAGKTYHKEGVFDLAMTQYQKALKIAKKLDRKDYLLSEVYRSIGSLVLADEGTNPSDTRSIFRCAKKAQKRETEDPNGDKRSRETWLKIDLNESFVKMAMANHKKSFGMISLGQASKEVAQAKRRLEDSGLANRYPRAYSRILNLYGEVASESREFETAEKAFFHSLALELYDKSADSQWLLKMLNVPHHQCMDICTNKLLKVLELKLDPVSKNFNSNLEHTLMKRLVRLFSRRDHQLKCDTETNRNLGEILLSMSKHYQRKGDRSAAENKYFRYAVPIFQVTYGQYHPAMVDLYKMIAFFCHNGEDLEKRNICCDKAINVLEHFERSSHSWKYKKGFFEEFKGSGKDGVSKFWIIKRSLFDM